MDTPTSNLKLTDFMDVATLQEIQDSFASVAKVKATIADATGNVLTQPHPTNDFVERQNAIARAESEIPEVEKQGRTYVAPIIVQGQKLGTIRMSIGPNTGPLDDTALNKLAARHQLDPKLLRTLARSLTSTPATRAAAVQFVTMLANAIARLCFQEFELRQRINELTTVYNVTMLLTEPRDIKRLLDRTVRAVCEVMDVKAASIRLIDSERDELVVKAVCNLSTRYLSKGPVLRSRSEIDQLAMSERGYEIVRNMQTDSRVLYPEDAKEEGIASVLTVGLRYRGRVLGTLRVYTSDERTFELHEINLLKAIAAQASAAIEHARLLEESLAAEAIERQVRMAADVQMRMLPKSPPKPPGAELAYAYVPCFDLAGDFFDFIELPDNNVGVVIADVSGKGVPASLIMASVRAALRAQVDNVYNLEEIIRRLNITLYRDTMTQEFVTLFYGVFNARQKRFTYCNAGHLPPLLLRNGKLQELAGDNMVLGVDPEQTFKSNIVDLRAGDQLLLYTDGVLDAMNFDQERYGKDRLYACVKEGAASARAMTDKVLWDIRRFVGLTQRTDDVTMIAMRMV